MFVAICDDDPQDLEHYGQAVVRLCKTHAIPLTLESYSSGTQLLFELSGAADQPDIVLLDIGLPKTDGMEVASQLRQAGYQGVIVFVTVRDNRMLEAFDVGAFNYVVKDEPHADERFERVFLGAASHVRARQRRYLLCNGISEHRNIPLDAITHFTMNRHVCTVHYGTGNTFEFISSLARLDTMLAASGFLRIQRSYMVNCAHVASYTYKTCTLDTGEQLTVGRKYTSALRTVMEAQAHAVAGKETKETKAETET